MPLLSPKEIQDERSKRFRKNFRQMLRRVHNGGVGKGKASNVFPSNLATMDASFSTEQYFGLTLPNDGSNAQDGRFLREFVTNLVPNFAENIDGSVKTFNNNNFVRRTTRGLIIDHDRVNSCIRNRDLTDASWTKGGAPTVAKTATGRTGVTNSCSLVTLTGAQATFTQAITIASSTFIMQIEVKRVTGTPTGRISFDNGSTYTTLNVTIPIPGAGALSFCKTRTAQQVLANPTVIIEINGTNGDQVAIDFVEIIPYFDGGGAVVMPTYGPIQTLATSIQGWRDRAAAYNTDVPPSNMAVFMNTSPVQVYYWEYFQRLDGTLISSDGGIQITTSSVTGCQIGAVITANKPVLSSDFYSPTMNKFMCGFTASESFACLNGGAVAIGAGVTPSGSATHFDFGTNGAANLRTDGAIKRMWAGTKYNASKAAAIAFTT